MTKFFQEKTMGLLTETAPNRERLWLIDGNASIGKGYGVVDRRSTVFICVDPEVEWMRK